MPLGKACTLPSEGTQIGNCTGSPPPLYLQASMSAMICPSLRFNASSHTGEAYSLQSEGPQIRDCTGSSPLSARNVLRSALFFNLLQNLDHAPLGRSLLHSKGSQIRGCTGSFKTSSHNGKLTRCNLKDLGSETAQDRPPSFASIIPEVICSHTLQKYDHASWESLHTAI